ncbi:ANTAR domain-containing protein [Rouxiella silvae]|nr:ANTAR domain-containing protein [Rouxiella silvae]MBF6638199.1 ANTAR domain-containing protein [Rouxiella silvae]
MQHHGLSEQHAHKTLRDMAMNQNKKLAEIAEAMLAVADLLAKKPNNPLRVVALAVCHQVVQKVSDSAIKGLGGTHYFITH